MGRFVAIATFLCCLKISTSLRNLSDYRVLRLEPSTTAQVTFVRNLHQDPSLDFWTEGDVMVDSTREKTLKQQLEKAGIYSSTLISNVQVLIDAEKATKPSARVDSQRHTFSFNKYYRFDEMSQQLLNFKNKHPKEVTLLKIGKTSHSRSILAIQISTGGNGTRPLIIIDAGIHAREWLAPATALYIIQELVENESNADLISAVDWHIIPVLNPDGYEYSHTVNRMWRKNRSTHQCNEDSESGVDLNRNFGYHWRESGASSYPCSDLFAGPNSFSELESRALRNYVYTRRARTELYLTLHTYGQYVVYPWGYSTALPGDWRRLEEVATRATEALEPLIQPWVVGPTGLVMYPAAGGSDDWVKAVAGVSLAYTVELEGGNPGGFVMPVEDLPRAVATFFPAVRVFGEHVAKPYYTSASAIVTVYLPYFWAVVTTQMLILGSS